MTSISSINAQTLQSPRDKLQNELLSEIASGKISSDDQQALSNALDDIDSQLKSAAGGTSRPSPTEIKSKIDGLIQSEVDNGKLTADQAKELKNLFANAHPPRAFSSELAGDTGDNSNTDVVQLLQNFLKALQQSQDSSGYNGFGDIQSQLKSMLLDYQA